MKESEYCDATDLAKIRCASMILREVMLYTRPELKEKLSYALSSLITASDALFEAIKND